MYQRYGIDEKTLVLKLNTLFSVNLLFDVQDGDIEVIFDDVSICNFGKVSGARTKCKIFYTKFSRKMACFIAEFLKQIFNGLIATYLLTQKERT